MNTAINTAADVENRVQTIMKPFAQPWRWFREGAWIVLEPPNWIIDAKTMHYVHQRPEVHTVEAVFRSTPSPGEYLRFRLREITP